ncbi:terpene synthase family protein [Streptomyces lasalocidi]
MLEPSAGRELPDAVRKNPAYRRAALLTQEFAAWYNDLCSLPKEIAGDEVHNLGISLITHEGLTLEEAVDEVRRRVEKCLQEFLEAEQEALRFADAIADGTAPGLGAERQRTEHRGARLCRQYAELVQLRLLVPPRVRPVHGRQLGRPVHAPVRDERNGR